MHSYSTFCAQGCVVVELQGKEAEIVALGTDLIEGMEVDVKVSLSQRSVLDEALLLSTYGVTAEQMKLYNACKKDGKTFEVLKVVPKKGKE